MTSGGARNRSGPPADPSSARSEQRGLQIQTLPASFDGPVPAFPLPDPLDRELELWAEAWTWPQANFWSQASESWRQRIVALWVRTSVRCETSDAPASLLAQLHRFADQSALTTAGLREVGLAVARDEFTAAQQAKNPKSSSRDRLKSVTADGA